MLAGWPLQFTKVCGSHRLHTAFSLDPKAPNLCRPPVARRSKHRRHPPRISIGTRSPLARGRLHRLGAHPNVVKCDILPACTSPYCLRWQSSLVTDPHGHRLWDKCLGVRSLRDPRLVSPLFSILSDVTTLREKRNVFLRGKRVSDTQDGVDSRCDWPHGHLTCCQLKEDVLVLLTSRIIQIHGINYRQTHFRHTERRLYDPFRWSLFPKHFNCEFTQSQPSLFCLREIHPNLCRPWSSLIMNIISSI